MSDGGFTLHAATVAGGRDPIGREALVSYALRPPLAQERLTRPGDDLIRIALKRPFSDGTVAVDLDPLSLLCRLVPLVPPPRFHTVRYAGVLASASRLRSRIVPRPSSTDPAEPVEPRAPLGGSRFGWRPWAELMQRVFEIDLEHCPLCGAPMKLRALVTAPANIRRSRSSSRSSYRWLEATPADVPEPRGAPGAVVYPATLSVGVAE